MFTKTHNNLRFSHPNFSKQSARAHFLNPTVVIVVGIVIAIVFGIVIVIATAVVIAVVCVVSAIARSQDGFVLRDQGLRASAHVAICSAALLGNCRRGPMSFAEQVAGGWVGCLHEHGRWSPAIFEINFTT